MEAVDLWSVYSLNKHLRGPSMCWISIWASGRVSTKGLGKHGSQYSFLGGCLWDSSSNGVGVITSSAPPATPLLWLPPAGPERSTCMIFWPHDRARPPTKASSPPRPVAPPCYPDPTPQQGGQLLALPPSPNSCNVTNSRLSPPCELLLPALSLLARVSVRTPPLPWLCLLLPVISDAQLWAHQRMC